MCRALRGSRRLAGLVLGWGLLVASSAVAQEAAPPERTIGLSVGYVHGFKEFDSGNREGNELRGLTVLPHWQAAFGPRFGEGGAGSGRLAFRAEGTLITAFEPHDGIAGGLGLLFRYEFDRYDRGDAGFLPYLQVGAGFLGIDLDIEDQADGFAFQPQAGVGLRKRVDRNLSVDLGVRYHHISNAYTQHPNGGIDSVQLLLGVAWRTD